jgi:hypothetical protein
MSRLVMDCAAPAGHFSYRRVAWEVFLKLQRHYPSLARHIRVTDFTQPIDIFQRRNPTPDR